MASNALEQVPKLVPADDFQTLEEKIYRTIETVSYTHLDVYKRQDQGRAFAGRDHRDGRRIESGFSNLVLKSSSQA